MKKQSIPYSLRFIYPAIVAMLMAIAAARPVSGSTVVITDTSAATTNAASSASPSSTTKITSTNDADDDDDKGHSIKMDFSTKHDSDDSILDDIIPLVAIVATFGTPILIVFIVAYFKYRRRRENVALARDYLNKGLPVPPELLDPSQGVSIDLKGLPNRPNSDLRKGFRLTFIGLGVALALYVNSPHSTMWGWGLIPMVMGIGFLFSGWAERGKNPGPENNSINIPPPPGPRNPL